MIRVVSYRKAILAGIAGALAWELAARLLILAGLPMTDIVFLLGTLVVGHAPWALWWPVGLMLHAGAGALWAIFYAYFVFGSRDWPGPILGLAFAFVPALFTIPIMEPQLELMNPLLGDAIHYSGLFGLSDGWFQPAGLLLGHLVYGLTLGTLYRRPVGHRTGRYALRPAKTAAIPSSHPELPAKERADFRTTRGPSPPPCDEPARFMFATGIECSYPTIEGGRWRVDQMATCGHYRRWREDLELVRALGLRYLRYGPPLHEIYRGPGRFDWSFMDGVSEAMQRLGIVPIIDLCHFGVPDWLENFQNPQVPEALAAYAEAFAERYPWIQLYTPVNEMYVCARLSALEGLWNEQCRDERSFVRAVHHLAKAAVLITQAIRKVRPDAVFVNNESSEFYQPCCPDPDVRRTADFENERRFIPLDLLYGRHVGNDVRTYLLDHGLAEEEYAWFMRQTVPERTILGVDYYDWNERVIDEKGHAESLGELFGWYVITSQYYRRYRRLMMHTETNCGNSNLGPQWLWRQWHNVDHIRQAGVPVVGFTWYSLTDQTDWDIALAAPRGNVFPVGLFDLSRELRPVGLAYRDLIAMYEPDLRTTFPWQRAGNARGDRVQSS